MSLMDWIGLVVAVGLGVYLVIALLWSEEFK